jgi:carboxyl-terminal processing protease
MKRAVVMFQLSFLLIVSLLSQELDPSKITQMKDQWTGTDEQKIWGLMTIWSEAKFNFPFFDRIPDVDWDCKVREYIPRVINAMNIEDYYDVLMEFTALLKDGHTAVFPPWMYVKPGYDHPPVELKIIENKFVVVRVGNTDEMKTQRIYPGLEIVEIGDNISMREYLKKKVLRFYSYGTIQANESIGLIRIFDGPQNSKIALRVKDPDSTLRNVTITRNSSEKDGSSFQWQWVRWFMFDPVIETRMIQSDICYIRISNFGSQKVVEEFHKAFDTLDMITINGIILDIRYNSGGSSSYAYNIVSSLTDKPLMASKWKSFSYVPAYRSWGQPTGWLEKSPSIIEPVNGKRYTGPLVVLTGPGTFSAAEDFLVPLKYSKRALLVGEKTAGSTGNPIAVALPGGGTFRVVSKRDIFPDGKEFVGIGIIPDMEVKVTQQDIIGKNDPVLNKGIDVIRNWGKYKN